MTIFYVINFIEHGFYTYCARTCIIVYYLLSILRIDYYYIIIYYYIGFIYIIIIIITIIADVSPDAVPPCSLRIYAGPQACEHFTEDDRLLPSLAEKLGGAPGQAFIPRIYIIITFKYH